MAYIEKRTSKNRMNTFRVKIRKKGVPMLTATFKRLTDAKKWVTTQEAAIIEKRYFKTSEATKHTLGELIDRYINEILVRKPKSMKVQKTQLLWWKNELGAYFLADITPSLIASCRDKLANRLSRRNIKITPATVNRYLRLLLR